MGKEKFPSRLHDLSIRALVATYPLAHCAGCVNKYTDMYVYIYIFIFVYIYLCPGGGARVMRCEERTRMQQPRASGTGNLLKYHRFGVLWGWPASQRTHLLPTFGSTCIASLQENENVPKQTPLSMAVDMGTLDMQDSALMTLFSTAT